MGEKEWGMGEQSPGWYLLNICEAREADGGFSSAFWPAGSSSRAPALPVRGRPPFACWFICLFVLETGSQVAQAGLSF